MGIPEYRDVTHNLPMVIPLGKYNGYITAKEYCINILGTLYYIPKNFFFDGASIPSVFGISWKVTYSKYDPKVLRASLVHDWLCEKRPKYISSKQAHKIFYDLCILDGCSKIKASLMLIALKIGGPRWK